MTGSVALTIVVDNEARGDLIAEHGFAVWIEVDETRVLLDTGAGEAARVNADRLGIDLSAADAIVLSHGHHDHTGGLPHILPLAPRAEVIHGPGIEVTRFSLHPGKPPRAIGMPDPARRALASLPDTRRRTIDGPARLSPRIGVTGPIPRPHAFEDTGGPFHLDDAGTRVDTIADDQALWIDTDTGLVIVLGCCHAGLTNTVERVVAAAASRRVRGILGGTHLVNANERRVERSIDALRSWDLEFLVPCHCSGAVATAAIGDALGPVVRRGGAGTRLIL